MSDEIRPPPFPLAKDADTEPGIGVDIEKLTLKRENMRLRQERNEARQELSKALLDSVPPPTRKQKTVKKTASIMGQLGKYGLVGLGIAAIARAAAKKWWPDGYEVIDTGLSAVGL